MIKANLPNEIRTGRTDSRRNEVAISLADLVVDNLRGLGAQAAPALQAKSAPFLVWGRGYVTAENTPHGIAMSFKPEAEETRDAPRSAMHVEAVRQLAHDLSKGAAENSGAVPQMLFAPIYLGLEDAIGSGWVIVKGRARG